MKHQKCMNGGCDHGAKYIPEIFVPAKGWALDSHPHVSTMCGMPLCEDHMNELKVEDFIGRFDVDGKNDPLNKIAVYKCPALRALHDKARTAVMRTAAKIIPFKRPMK